MLGSVADECSIEVQVNVSANSFVIGFGKLGSSRQDPGEFYRCAILNVLATPSNSILEVISGDEIICRDEDYDIKA